MDPQVEATADETPEVTEPVATPGVAAAETPVPAPQPVAPVTPAATPVAQEEDDTQVFTAEDVTRMIQARVGRMQKQHEKELAEAKAAGGGQSLADAEAKVAAAEARIAEVEATYAIRFAAVSAGVPADQTDAIVKLADASDLRGESGVDADKVAAAVKSVLDRYPGLAAKATETPAPTHTPAAQGVGGGPAQADPQKQEASSLMDAVVAKLGG